MKAESRNSQHCNGYWNEYREFRCGAKFHFSPNFVKVIQTEPCQNTPDYKQTMVKRRTAGHQIIDFVDGVDADKSFKDRIHYWLRNVLWSEYDQRGRQP